jgi:fructokinase
VAGAPVPVEVVDTVGAGDAFTSAALDTLHTLSLTGAAARSRLPAALDAAVLTRVLHRAGAAASLTVSRAGARPPDAAELSAAVAAPTR